MSIDSNDRGNIGLASNYGSTNNIQARYGSGGNEGSYGVQVTSSRITTDKGEFGSGGQMTISRPEGYGSSSTYMKATNITQAGENGTGVRKYQFH